MGFHLLSIFRKEKLMLDICQLIFKSVLKVKNILNQVLDHNSQLTLNACDLRQKN
jgi:hypothetical protein